MNDEFYEWLNKCPAQWFLQSSDNNGREYWFKDNEKYN